MKILDENLPKIANYAILFMALLITLSFLRSCSSNKEDIKMRKEITKLNASVDSLNLELNNNFYTKEQFDTKLEMEGFEISKRMLYDNNAIIRTSIRPDDRMAEYDKKIKELQNKLN